MKKTVITGTLVLALGLLSVSCSDESTTFGSGTGRIMPTIGCDTETLGAESALSRAEGDDITVDDLSLTLLKEDGSFKQTWDKIADFDSQKQFATGEYTIEAFYGNAADEGFEKPAFYGSQKLIVADGQTTRVALTASRSNAMFNITFTEAFRNYMSDYDAKVLTANGTVEYSKYETRPVYVAPGEVRLNVRVVKPNGLEANFEIAKVNAAARYCYNVTVDVNSGNAGDATLSVSFSEELSQEEVIIDLSDELMSAPAPVINAEGFTEGTPVEMIAGVPCTSPLRMDIVALAGIKSAVLTTQCESLINQGWPASLELVGASAQDQITLNNSGLRVLGLWKEVLPMATIDFAGIAENMKGGQAVFSLTVTDKLSRTVEKPVTLTATYIEPVMETANISGQYFQPGEDLSFSLTTNVPVAADNISVQYTNERGITANATIKSVVAGSRANTAYTVTIVSPTDIDGSFVLEVVCGKIRSPKLTVADVPFAISVAEADVFATHATATTVATPGNSAPSTADATYYIKAAGQRDYTKATGTANGASFSFSGLSAATEYSAYVRIGRYNSKPVSFTTESATQLPNSGLEDWCQTSGESNWELIFPGATQESSVWGTNNPMTTSQGSNYAYCRISGTKSTTAGHTGKAACISTQGWGSGNTAIGTAEGGSVCKYIDAGLLHLGASRTTRPSGYGDRSGSLLTDDLNCGIEFASRPASLTFWYKYEAKNSSDYGTALAQVFDAKGNVIAEGTVNLSAKSDYTQSSIALSYKAGSAKAAKIYVRFLSTGVASALTKSNSWIGAPAFANVSRGEYYGSRLYIDDIELTY